MYVCVCTHARVCVRERKVWFCLHVFVFACACVQINLCSVTFRLKSINVFFLLFGIRRCHQSGILELFKVSIAAFIKVF